MMKKFTSYQNNFCKLIMVLLAVFWSVMANSQTKSIQNNNNSKPKSVEGSEVIATSASYIPGTTMDLNLQLNFVSIGLEYCKTVTLDFPTGVVVNSATAIGGLNYNGTTGDGIMGTWNGTISSTSSHSFIVNVTIDGAYTGDLSMDYTITGDIYGPEPHSVSGTCSISEASGEDAGISALVNPGVSFPTGTEDVIVTLENYGTNNLTSASIDWSVNGVNQTTFNWTGNLANGESEDVTLGSFDFTTGGSYNIIVETSSPNSLTDGNTSNDQLNTDVMAIGAIILPYNQNFDAVTAPAVPADWSVIDSDASTSTYVKTQNYGSSYSSPNEVVMYNYFTLNMDLLLISPLLSDVSAVKVKFYGAGSSLSIGTISDPSNASTYSELENVTLTSEYTEYTVDFTSYAGTDKYIAFKHPATEYMKYVYIDNITIQEPSPYELTLNSLNENKVVANGEMVKYKVEVKNSGLNSDTYNLSILNNESSWNYVIRNSSDNADITSLALNAGEKDTIILQALIPSDFTGEFTDDFRFAAVSQADVNVTDTIDFSTSAYEAYIGINEGFETSTEIPDYWTTMINGEASHGSFMVRNYGLDAHSGSNAMRVSSGIASPELYIVSPALVGNGTGYIVDYWAKGATGRDVIVGVMTDKYDYSTFTAIETLNLTSSYQEDFVNILINDAVGYIAFKPTFTSGFQSTDIDDIMISKLADYDAGISVVNEPSEIVEIGSHDIKVNIKNYGSVNLTSATVNWSVNDGNGEITQTPYNWAGNIALSESDANINIGSFDFTTGGYYDVKVWTTSPNSNTDENNLNDTITKQVYVIAPIAAPYTENFDAVTKPGLPMGWRKIVNSSNTSVVIDTYNSANSLPNSVRMYNAGDASAELVLVSPPVETFEGNRLKIFAQGGSGFALKVGTMSDPEDASTFEEFESIDIPFGFYEYTIDFYKYSGTDKYIAFKHGLGGTYRTMYIDDFTWEEVPFIDPDNADFNYLAVNDTSEAKVFTITNSTASVINLTASDITITGTDADQFIIDQLTDVTLNPSENAEINVRFAPKSEGIKNASLTVTTATKAVYNVPLNAHALPENSLIEYFEGNWLPAGWSQEDPFGWEKRASSGIEGNYNAYIGYGTYKLVTPKLIINEGDSLTFSARNSIHGGNLIVQISENGIDWTDLVDLSGTITSTVQSYKIDFSANDAGQAYIAFKGSAYIYLDEVLGPVMLELSKDANLADLALGSETLSGFDPEIYEYDITLPSGTTLAPWVNATPNHNNAVADVTQAAGLPGTATVLVTAEDQETENTYTINFTVAASNDSTLKELYVDGTLVNEFSPEIHSYDFVLPYGTVDLPVVTAITNDENANAVINNVTQVPGTASVIVTSADNTSSLTYEIDFTVAANTDATLSDLKVDGSTVDGFSSETLVYAVELPYGTTNIPTVEGTASDLNANVAVNDATALPGTTTVIVTAEDENTKKTYEVNFTIAANTDATLSDLKVDGSTVDGFSSETLVYTVELPYGTITIPTVEGTTSDLNANIVVNDAIALPGTTTIMVTAEDETTTKIYEINFTLADPNTDATLSGISIDGEPMPEFDSATETYNMELAEGTTEVPTLTAEASHDSANVQITEADELPGSTIILVTAQDGVTTKTYTVNFNLATGIDFMLENAVKVFPIPNQGEFTVDLGYNIQSKVLWKLCNLNGQVVAYGVTNQSRFEIKNYSRGVYILTIDVDQQTITKRIIIE